MSDSGGAKDAAIAFEESINIKLAGQDLQEALKVRVANIKLVQRLNDHHRFEMECLSLAVADGGSLRGKSDVLDDLQEKIGADMEISLGAGSETHINFKGVVTELKSRRSVNGEYAVTLCGYSPSKLFDEVPMSRVFEEMKLSDVISEVLGDRGFSAKVDATNIERKWLWQHNQTDYEFLLDRCQREGLWFFYDGKEFHAKKDPTGPATKLSLGRSLFDFNVESHISSSRVAAAAWDPVSRKPIGASVESLKSSSGVKPMERAAKTSDKTFAKVGDVDYPEHLEDAVGVTEDMKQRHLSWAGSLVEGRGSSDDYALGLGGVVTIEGTGPQMDGDYIVAEVEHVIGGEGRGYRNNFRCVPKDAAHPPRTVEPPAVPVVWGGTVTDTADPEARGRVRVQIHRAHGGNVGDWTLESFWARVATFHAGPGHGSFILPEIGDEVILAALDGDVSNLLVLGYLYNGQSDSDNAPIKRVYSDLSPSEAEKGTGKLFLTRSGNRLFFDDTDGEERVEISSPGEANRVTLTMKDNGAIEIHTDGKLNVTAKDVMSFEADKDITIKTEASLTMESGGDMTIKSGGKLDIEASGEATVKGMAVKCNGGGSVEMTQTGVDVKGTMIKLN